MRHIRLDRGRRPRVQKAFHDLARSPIRRLMLCPQGPEPGSFELGARDMVQPVGVASAIRRWDCNGRAVLSSHDWMNQTRLEAVPTKGGQPQGSWGLAASGCIQKYGAGPTSTSSRLSTRYILPPCLRPLPVWPPHPHLSSARSTEQASLDGLDTSGQACNTRINATPSATPTSRAGLSFLACLAVTVHGDHGLLAPVHS